MDETKEMLKRQIDTDIQSLSTLESGSQEKASAVDDLTKLYGILNEDEKSKNETLHRFIQYGLTGIQIVAPLVFYGVWMKRGFEFEKEGTYTSQTFRNMFGKFKPTK